MKFILLVVLGFLAFSFVEAGDPWSCSLGCTDRYGLCGMTRWSGGNDCETRMWNCANCSLTSGSYTYCGTSYDCIDYDWIYILVGVSCFVFFGIIIIIIVVRRRRQAKENALLQANYQQQQLAQTQNAQVTTVTYGQPIQNLNTGFNAPPQQQNQQFYQPPQQANVVYN